MHDSKLVQEWAEATMHFCADSAIVYYDDWAAILHGWALTEQGFASDGLEQMQKGLAGLEKSNSRARLPYYRTIMAEAHARAGQIETGLNLLSEALDTANSSKDYWYSAEMHRTMGQLLLLAGDTDRAATWLLQGLEISRQQRARSFELRTAITLSRLWQRKRQPDGAYAALERALSHFTPQTETADLQDARALLKELSQNRHLD